MYDQKNIEAQAEAAAKASRDQMNHSEGIVHVDEPLSADGLQVVFQTGHTSGIGQVVMSPDGRYVLSSDSHLVKVWEVASHKEVRSFTVEAGVSAGGTMSLKGLSAVAGFSPDGRRLVINGRYGQQAKLYDVDTGAQIASGSVISADTRIAVSDGRDENPSYLAASRGRSGLTVIDLTSKQQSTFTASRLGVFSAPQLSANGATLVANEVRPNTGSGLSEALGIGGAQAQEGTSFITAWDVGSRHKLLSLPSSLFAAAQVRLSGDGSLLFVGNSDGSIDCYELRTGRKHTVVATADARSNSTEETAFSRRAMFEVSASGRALALTHSDGSIDIYDPLSSQKLLSLPAEEAPKEPALPPGMVLAAGQPKHWEFWSSFSDDGRLFAAGELSYSGASARVWEIPSGRRILRTDANTIAFSADDRTAVVGRSNEGGPILHDIASAKEESFTAGVHALSHVSLMANGRLALATRSNGDAQLWDLATGELNGSFTCPNGAAISSASASTRDSLMAASCQDGSAWLWDPILGQFKQMLTSPASPGPYASSLVAFSTDGRLLAISGKQEVAVWDALNHSQIGKISTAGDLVQSREEQMAHRAGETEIDPQTLEQLPKDAREFIENSQRAFKQYTSDPNYQQIQRTAAQFIEAIAVDPIHHLLALSRSGQVSLWDFQTGQRVRVVTGNEIEPRALAFTVDGQTLLIGSTKWKVPTGQRIPEPQAVEATPPTPNRVPLTQPASPMDVQASDAVAALSPDGQIEAQPVGLVVRLSNATTGQEIADLVGHTDLVASAVFSQDGKTLVSAGADGSLRVWNVATRKEVVALYALGATDFVAVTPDQYYRASKSRLAGISFRARDQLYPFEQFDLRFNRPDILVERLGRASDVEIQSYRALRERRLKKLGFSEAMLSGELHVPEIAIVNESPPASTDATSLTLRIRANDERYLLDRINVFVNDVPVYGAAGLPILDRQAHREERQIDVPLVSGSNKVQVSVLNQQGTESLRRTLYLTSTTDGRPRDVYVVAIGVSTYRDSQYDLRFAAKDARDLIKFYRGVEDRSGASGQLHVLDLTNEKATRAEIVRGREWLQQAHPNDLAVVFAAGHGITDSQKNYYFGTYDIDPDQPQINGLPYEEFDALLDGIPALKKLLLLDTCFSGEIDKDAPVDVAGAETTSDGTVKMRAFKVVASEGTTTPLLAAGTQRLHDMFADLRSGTGAVVISSASGNEYALEGGPYRNGVFTYALLSGLREGRADANKDGTVTVSELQTYVIDEVRKLTAGAQNPTVRRENLDFDFPVY